jgi:hypothetical protein
LNTYGKPTGQAMVEFLIIIPVLILLIFGAIQIGFIYSAKTTLNYATFQSARLASVNNATYSSMRRGLIRGLAPLYTNNGSLTSIQADIEAGIDSSGTKRDASSEVDNYTRIIRISPMSSHFSTSAFGELNDDGIYEIPNDNLMYRPDIESDGVSIQDANLLKIHVQYCYKLMVPLVNRVIGSLSELQNTRTNQQVYETVNDPKFADANRYYTNQTAAWQIMRSCAVSEQMAMKGLLSLPMQSFECSLQRMRKRMVTFLVTCVTVQRWPVRRIGELERLCLFS